MRLPPILLAVAVATGLPAALGAQQAVGAPASAAAGATPDSAYRAPVATRGAGPNGATLRCRDGSYPAAGAPDSACEGKGGVLARFPLLKTPPAPTPREARAAGTAPAAPPPAEARAVPAPVESKAALLIPAARPPADATMQCKDGTFVRADTASVRCAPYGGVLVRFPARRPR